MASGENWGRVKLLKGSLEMEELLGRKTSSENLIPVALHLETISTKTEFFKSCCCCCLAKEG
jgi:hypothetical protein